MPGLRHALQSAGIKASTNTLLYEWMCGAGSGYSSRTLAWNIGVTQRALLNVAYGHSMPSLVTAYKIEQVTEGAVPVESWLGTDIGRAQWKELEVRSAFLHKKGAG